ncbi:hypothetical protein PFISCL1PPCAC_28742, partial [Pristionchus fissidentatus]
SKMYHHSLISTRTRRMGASAGEMALVCKQNLRSSLLVADQLTARGLTPPAVLLNRMNAVLSLAVESHFGSATSDGLHALFETINRLQQPMQDTNDDLSLFFFARSFAVVMEEAVAVRNRLAKMEEKEQPHCACTTTERAETARASCEDEKELEKDEIQRSPESPCADACEESVQQMQQHDLRRLQQNLIECLQHLQLQKQKSEQQLQQMPDRPAQSIVGSDPSAMSKSPHETEKRPTNDLDYSSEARKGRITVYRIPATASLREVQQFLRPIGPIMELSYPRKPNGQHRSFAFAKFETNEEADEAVRRLHLTRLGGREVCVKRTEFWFRNEPRSSPLRAPADERHPPQFGSGEQPPEYDDSPLCT